MSEISSSSDNVYFKLTFLELDQHSGHKLEVLICCKEQQCNDSGKSV